MRSAKLFTASLLLAAGVAQAGTPCNHFKITVHNETSDPMTVTKSEIRYASLSDGLGVQIPVNGTHIFTINNSEDGKGIEGYFDLKPTTLPSRVAKFAFLLTNADICKFAPASLASEYSIATSNITSSSVTYTIR